MIQIQTSVSKGWLNKNANFTFAEAYYLDPLHKLKIDREINAYLRERFPCYALYNMEDNLVLSEYYNENLIQVGAIQPNMVIAVILGSEFTFFGDKDADVRGLPFKEISGKEELPSHEEIIHHPFVEQLTKQISDLKEQYPELRVIPPFFWDTSGRAVIHGMITTSLKLVGENIMIMMILDPELVHSIHQWITDTYILLIKHFSTVAACPSLRCM